MTPLLYAARDGRAAEAELLLAAGADVELARSQRHAAAADGAAQQSARGRAPAARARRRRQRRRLLGPHAAVRRRRLPQPRHEQSRRGQPDDELRRPRAAARADRASSSSTAPTSTRARARCRRAAAGSTRSATCRGWTSRARRRSCARRCPATSRRCACCSSTAPTRTLPTLAGTTPLMAAAGVNWVVAQTYTESPQALLDAVQLCLEHGADVNAVNSMGLTALLGAANRGAERHHSRACRATARGSTSSTRKAARRCAGRKACSSPPSAPSASPRRSRCSKSSARRGSRHADMRHVAIGRHRQRRRTGARLRRCTCARTDTPSAADHWALVDRYCVTCHNDLELAGEVAFDRLEPRRRSRPTQPSGRRRSASCAA